VGAMGAQDRRLEAIAAAAAAALSETEYHKVRTQDVAVRIRLDDSGDGRSSGGSRSAVWVYSEARSRRVLVALAARHAWNDYPAQTGRPGVQAEPRTVADAVGLVAAALLEIARFQRAAQFLMRQVGLGIGDIATSEKRAGADAQQAPSWPDSAWGRVAADGFDGRCSAYADYLAPVLLAAGRSVCPLSGAESRAQARALSDLAFRALLADRDGPLDRVADALAAYWFERDLVLVSGRWIHNLAAAERATAYGTQRARDARADAAQRGILADTLLESGTLYARCADVGAVRVRLLAGIADPESVHVEAAHSEAAGSEPTRPESARSGPVAGRSGRRGAQRPAEPSDLRALCDAASRQGLALLRYGELAAAAEAHGLSLKVARERLGQHDRGEAASYAARAQHNLAEVALERGAHAEAVELCESAYEERRRLAGLAQGATAEWRRLSLTAELRTRVATAAGRPVQAVRSAELLFEDRVARLGGADNASAAAARTVLGRALLAAGHPLAAQYHLEAAHRFHTAKSVAFGYTVQGDVVGLAEVALALSDPAQAERLLPAPDTVDWFGERVSRRLAAQLRRLRVTALGRLGRIAEAESILEHAFDAFGPADPADADPLLLSLDRCRAELAWRSGRPEAAAEILERVRAAAHRLDGGAFCVDAALTSGCLARCADAIGDKAAAVEHYTRLRTAAQGVLDPTHVVLLRADLDQARRLLTAADIDGAGRLVTVLLDRTPLAHGRPALEDGHPLYAQARRLAQDIGIPAAEPADYDWGNE
jgi:tetratricopeptide (TPR) repeat protein